MDMPVQRGGGTKAEIFVPGLEHVYNITGFQERSWPGIFPETFPGKLRKPGMHILSKKNPDKSFLVFAKLFCWFQWHCYCKPGLVHFYSHVPTLACSSSATEITKIVKFTQKIQKYVISVALPLQARVGTCFIAMYQPWLAVAMPSKPLKIHKFLQYSRECFWYSRYIPGDC